jgi:hypothetical protein
MGNLSGWIKKLKSMKKFFMVFMVVVIAMVANAQVITDIVRENGSTAWVYMNNGQKVRYESLPRGVHYERGYTPEQCIQRSAANAYYDEMQHYQLPVNAGYGMYGAVGVPVGIYGGTGSSISIGNEHWGFSTSSSNYGGYKTSSTGVRIGSFHIGTSNAGYTSSSSYETQKKADAKAATTRYSNMKSNNKVATSSNTRSTTYNNVKEVNINDLMRCYK